MSRITLEPGYSDIYSDIYGGAVGDIYLYVDLALNPPSEAPEWTDISEYVRSLSTKRGRASEEDSFSAGTCAVVLDNRDRRFDPSYSGSPYYPDVRPMRGLRVRLAYNGTTYSLFTGYTDGFPQDYLNPSDGYVELTAADAFKVFGSVVTPHPFVQLDDELGGVLDKAKLGGPLDVIEETTGARIDRVLVALEWPATDIDDGRSTLPPGQGTGGALSYLQEVAVTEDGRLFVAGDGTVTFLDRHAPFLDAVSNTSQATFGDGAGELRYTDVRLSYDDRQIRNHVLIQFEEENGDSISEISIEDEDSIAEYLRHSYSRSVLYSDPVEAENLAEYILDRYKDPFLRVESISVKPFRDYTNLVPQVLGREIGDRVTVKRRPQAIGTAISLPALIEGVSHSLSPGDNRWDVEFNLSPADTKNYLILNDSSFGLLDTASLGY